MAGGANGLVVQQVIETLKGGIQSGRFVPGQRLVEADLIRDLGFGRDSIREALRQVAAEGLVEIEAYKGASVRRLGREDIREIFEMREVLEGKAAALAARAVGNKKLRKRFEIAIARNRRFTDKDDMVAYVADNREFHDTIIAMANNKRLAATLETLQIPTYRWQFQRLLMPQAKNQSIKEHVKIADAILAGDEKKAEAEMRRHVRQSGTVLQSFADEYFAGGA